MHDRPLILNYYRYRSTYFFRTPQVIPIYHHSCNCIIFPPRHGLFIGLTLSYIQMGDRNNPKMDDILKNTPVTDSPMPGTPELSSDSGSTLVCYSFVTLGCQQQYHIIQHLYGRILMATREHGFYLYYYFSFKTSPLQLRVRYT